MAIVVAVGFCALPPSAAHSPQQPDADTPPRVLQARRFLRRHNLPSRLRQSSALSLRLNPMMNPQLTSSSTMAWQPIGPTSVLTPNYGLVTGRVSSIAIDPADVTGNHVFIGTTGGGVWSSQNAAAFGNVVFTPLTDSPSPFDSFRYGSISIGAITVQPGGTGVILAGTGDPNDALDSYYGAGILRSADGGASWTAIPYTTDQVYSFMGEGFAGFAWSTINPQLVVAAVSQSYEGTLVNAPSKNTSYAGIYYSRDAGQTWSLARITDGGSNDVQGPTVSFAQPNGNSATAVVWNPVRQLFIAAVRFHGYYQSTDGITWTRMVSQPGNTITTQMCPSNRGTTGSIACPVLRGAIAVNPQTGDTFAWTVDLYNQDQGLWQDTCGKANGNCTSQTIAFSKQWSTDSFRTATPFGPATIANGDYDLVLAAVPSGQDTILLAGANDLWRCSLAVGCQWRNTTNANSCMSAQVAPYQHALAWNSANPQEVLIGNDSGLWRSMDAINESSSVCASDDANHFQNLNQGLGSLAEIESISQTGNSPFDMMVGLGVNGVAGIKNNSNPNSTWPQILAGEGSSVAIGDAIPENWYANASAGVSIYRCSQSDNCTPDAFGASPVIGNADVSGDGLTMTTPAPFLIDPLDPSQLLIGTCRMWRGPSDGTGWTAANAISPFLDGISGHTYCSGDGLIRSIAAMPVQGGGEVIYAGIFGSRNGGAIIGGHIFKATFVSRGSSPSSWSDLTYNPVANDQIPFNYYGMDISSIFIDPHDPSGNTVYVTIAGVSDLYHAICTVYRTTDGGAHWYDLRSNLRNIPVNDILIDSRDASTAYIATDDGVYSTRDISTCVAGRNECWSLLGSGLPDAPITHLVAVSGVLSAGTYGRGIWQIPLWSQGSQLASASIAPTSLTFPIQSVGSATSPQAITLRNTGSISISVSAISVNAPFSQTNDCQNASVSAGASCSIQVTFTPDSVGPANGSLEIEANTSDSPIHVALAGTGFSDSSVTASPGTLDFGQIAIGSTSDSQSITLQNAASNTVSVTSVATTLPFRISANPCGTTLAGNSACAISLVFVPTQTGTATGTLLIVDDAGTQKVELKGVGGAAATDSLSESSLTFPGTAIGQRSSPQDVTLFNDGDLPLPSITATSTPGFQASNTCGALLGAHSRCVISVVFTPETEGVVTGVLTISDAIRLQILPLSGTGLLAPAIKVSPTRIAFPSQVVGEKGSNVPLTITNSGGVPMADVGFQITGTAATSFSFGQSTCPSSLPAASSCTIQLTFVAGSIGQLSAALTVSSSTSGVAPVQVPMTGIGQGRSGITITPSQMSFTQMRLGEASAVQVATISNDSSTAASELSISASKPFSLTQSTCSSSLGPGASCSIGVVFTPAANAVVNGTVSASSPEFTDPAIAVLVGAGGAVGAIQVQPGSLTFGSAGVGTHSAIKKLALTNIGPVVLHDLQLSTSAEFVLVGSNCGASLDVGDACTVDISFAPSNAGPQEGRLTIAGESIAAPVQVPLSGLGFDFIIATAGQTSETIASGQKASFTLTVTPLNGSAGTFTLSCSALPANSSCSFNPLSESVPANMSGSMTVNISTGISSSTAGLPTSSETRKSRLLPFLSLLFLPFAIRSRNRSRWALALLAGAIGIASCAGAGGGSSGMPAPAKSNTPAGSYSIVVTATASGVSHNTTIKLIVD
ncbi:MAG TPA: choice-of-anchor D domain-containing protein [Terracidiphilus sp.]|nr:choice-of-anchor D domain-containing protein [Terracidiphilus sp.]